MEGLRPASSSFLSPPKTKPSHARLLSFPSTSHDSTNHLQYFLRTAQEARTVSLNPNFFYAPNASSPALLPFPISAISKRKALGLVSIPASPLLLHPPPPSYTPTLADVPALEELGELDEERKTKNQRPRSKPTICCLVSAQVFVCCSFGTSASIRPFIQTASTACYSAPHFTRKRAILSLPTVTVLGAFVQPAKQVKNKRSTQSLVFTLPFDDRRLKTTLCSTSPIRNSHCNSSHGLPHQMLTLLKL